MQGQPPGKYIVETLTDLLSWQSRVLLSGEPSTAHVFVATRVKNTFRQRWARNVAATTTSNNLPAEPCAKGLHRGLVRRLSSRTSRRRT